MPLSPLPPARAYLNGFVLGFADRFRSEELKHETAKVDATDSKVKPSGTGADSSSAGNGTVESDADTTPAVNVHSPFTLPAQMEPTGDAKAKGPAAPANAAVKAEPSDTLPHKQAGNGLFSMADAAAESSDPTTTDSRGNGDGMSSKLDVSDEVGDADGDDGANGDEQKDEEEGANDDDNEDDGDEGQGEGEGEGEGESEGESESGNESENEGESDGGDGGGSKTGSKAPKGSGPLVRTPPRLPRAQTTKPVATKPVTKPLHSDLSSSSSSSEEEEEAAPSSSESESESEPETRPGLRLVRRSLGRGQSSAPGSSGSDADSDAEEEVTVKPKTNKRSEADRGYTRSFARYDLSDEQGEADWERAADAAEAALEATADMEFAFAFDTEINEFDELDEAKDVPTQPRKAHERSPAEPASAALKRKTTRHSVPALVRPPMGRGGKIRSKPMGAFKLIALLASAMAALAFTVFLAVLPDASRVHLTSPAPVMRWAVSVKDAITTPLGLSATYTPGCQVIVPTCRNGRVAGHAPSAAQQPTRAVFFETQTVMFFFKGNSTGTATVGRCAEAARKYHELCENQKHEPVLTRFYDGNEPLCEFPPRDSISLPTHFEAMGYCNGEDACKRFAGLSDECSRFVSLPSPFDDPSLHTTADAALTTSEQTFADCLRLHFASNVTYLYRVRPPHPIKCVPSAGRRVKVNTEEGTYELVAKD